MDYIRDRFGNILSKDSIVAYVYNGLIERGRVVEAVRIGMPSSKIVRIEPFHVHMQLITRPANEVMKVLLPAT